MKRAFAQKLIFTAAALNCATRKELCARFRTVNPATEFELERSYKWLQGRALPRSQVIYDDWASVLGSDRPGTWLAACSVEAFVEDLCVLFSVDREDLLQRASAFSGDRAVLDDKPEQPADPVCGTFLCYSWAWSPQHRGELIRSWIEIAPKGRRALEATYWEELPDGVVLFRGDVLCDGSLLQCYLKSTGSRAREHLALTVLMPGRPVSLMCGRMQGAILAGAFIRPASTRIVLLRCDEESGADDRPCYLPASPEALEGELQALVPGSAAQDGLAQRVYRFLTAHDDGYADQILGEDLAGLMGV